MSTFDKFYNAVEDINIGSRALHITRNPTMPNVGIEIECESEVVDILSLNRFLSPFSNWNGGGNPNWDMCAEGSLRGGHLGWELRTRNTTGAGMEYDRAMAALNELIYPLRWSSGTWRAAVHAHVNVSNLQRPQLAIALALAYACDESMFDRFSPERRESNFAEPLKNKDSWVLEAISSFLTSTDPHSYGRYNSVNIEAMNRWGSFEFRHMQTPATSGDIEEVYAAIKEIGTYVSSCAALIQAAMAAPLQYYQGDVRSATLEAALWLASRYPIEVNPDDLAVAMSAMEESSNIDMTRFDLGSVVNAVLPRRHRRRNEYLDLSRPSAYMDDDGGPYIDLDEEYERMIETAHEVLEEMEDDNPPPRAQSWAEYAATRPEWTTASETFTVVLDDTVEEHPLTGGF